MVRWLMIGLMLGGLGIAFQNQWIRFDLRKFATDLNMPFMADPYPTRHFQFRRGAS